MGFTPARLVCRVVVCPFRGICHTVFYAPGQCPVGGTAVYRRATYRAHFCPQPFGQGASRPIPADACLSGHVPVIRGPYLQGKTCAEALGYWVGRHLYFVLKQAFQNKIVLINTLEDPMGNRKQSPLVTLLFKTHLRKKKHLPRGQSPKTGTFRARSGARTLDTLIKRRECHLAR